MNQVDVEINTQARKRGKTETDASQNAAVRKYVAGNKAREASFMLNFEACFLDMFETEPAPRAREAERSSETETDAAETGDSSLFDTLGPAPGIEDFENQDADFTAAPGDRAPVSNAAPVAEKPAEAPVAKPDAGAARAATDDAGAAAKSVVAELAQCIKNKMTEEEIADLTAQVDEILADEELSDEEMLASVSGLLAGLLNRLQTETAADGVAAEAAVAISAETVSAIIEDATAGMSMADMRRVVVKLAERVREAADEAAAPAAENAGAFELPEGMTEVDAEAEDVLLQLLKTVEKATASVEEDTPRILHAIDQELVDEFGTAVAREMDAATLRLKRTPTGEETAEARQERVEQAVSTNTDRVASVLPAQELAANLVQNRAGFTAHNAPANTVAATPVAEAGRFGRGAEGQNTAAWQQSYNQSSAFRDANLNAARSQAANAPQTTQPKNPIFDQIIQQARIVIADGKSEATITLHPEELGKVELKVTVEEKRATVEMKVENNVVRAAIQENLDELKKTLNELGLEVETLNVMLQGEFSGREQAAEEKSNGRGSSGARYLAGFGEDEEEETLRAVRLEEVDGSTVRYVA